MSDLVRQRPKPIRRQCQPLSICQPVKKVGLGQEVDHVVGQVDHNLMHTVNDGIVRNNKLMSKIIIIFSQIYGDKGKDVPKMSTLSWLRGWCIGWAVLHEVTVS